MQRLTRRVGGERTIRTHNESKGSDTSLVESFFSKVALERKLSSVMSCMRVCRKQALSRVKYYYYVINSKIQQQQ